MILMRHDFPAARPTPLPTPFGSRHPSPAVVTACIATAIALCALTPRNIAAQMPDSMNVSHSGIYRTSADFLAAKLDFGIDCHVEKHRIDRHTFLGRPYLDVTHGGETTRLQKRDVFAYRECDGTVMRFDDGREVTILGVGPIVLYAGAIMVSSGPKFMTRAEPVFYFGRTVADSLQPLTREALKNVFAGDHALHDRLDAAFSSDATLAAFDHRHHVYRVFRMISAGPAPNPRAP